MGDIVVLMGAQGAGKGTQAKLLAELTGLPVVATGDMLREVARSESELGRQVREHQEAGRLVPDEILAEVVRERTGREDCRGGYLLDGFPRTLPQAQLLDDISGNQGHRVLVVEIDVPADLIYKRLTGRRICSGCGAIYNIYFKPSRLDGVCDLDGGRLLTRSDDNEEAIAQRLALYDEKTKPLLKYYGESGRLRKVDGSGNPQEVFERLLESLRSGLTAGN